jgi:AcrR family transcriptional regulator
MMSMAPESVELREQATRARIVRAAQALFHRYGYQKTTVADIARDLGMSSANVYRFFESKKAINEAVALTLTGEVEAEARRNAAAAGPAAERLRKLLTDMHSMNAERYLRDLKMHEMVAVAITESWPIIRQHLETIHGILAELIREGIARGEFRDCDPVMAAHCVQAAMVRYCHPRLMVECAGMPHPTLDEMVDFLLASLSRPRPEGRGTA